MRICEQCGAEYKDDSQEKTCVAKYPDLFTPEAETNCGGAVLPPPKTQAEIALDLRRQHQ